ncbi:MAG: hypothetical protein JOZ27_01295, partial [Caulobacteraceae bacterium]|nr:hypothetical protein [Caulobacteraceae bacterium]
MKRIPLAAIAAAALVLSPAGGAGAAVTILGGGWAQSCSEAAFEGKSDNKSMLDCDIALHTEALDSRERGGTYINRGVMKLRRREFEPAHADFDAGIALVPAVGE